MFKTTKALKTIRSCAKIILREKYKNASIINEVPKRFKVSCCCDEPNDNYDMSSAFTHTPDQGYIRQSAVAPVILPNERIDQYVWKDFVKWQDQTAMVDFDARLQ